MILIRGGRLLDPATGRDERADIVLEDNKIKEIWGAGLSPERAYERVIEAENLAVAPGLWMHVHFRDPGLTYKEDIQRAPAPRQRAALPRWSAWRTRSPSWTMKRRCSMSSGREEDRNPRAQLRRGVKRALRAGNSRTWKGFWPPGRRVHGRRDPLMDGAFVKRAMEEAARLDTVLSFHEEG